MHKNYSLFAVLLMAFASLAAKGALITLDVEVNDPEQIKAQYYYTPGGTDLTTDAQVLSFDENNHAVIEYPDNAHAYVCYIYLTPITPPNSETIYLKKYTLYDADGAILKEATVNATTRKSVQVSTAADGGKLVVETGILKNGHFTLNIDGSAAAVKANLSGQTVTHLHDGSQSVEFTPTQTYLYLTPVGRPQFYEVKWNGNPVPAVASAVEEASLTYGYSINPLADGDVVDITVDYPQVNYPVRITTNDNLGFIQQVTVDDQAVDNWASDDFEVAAGSQIRVVGDRFNYLINATTINNEQKVPTHSVSWIVTEPLSIEFDVTYIERDKSFVYYSGPDQESSLRSNNGSSYLELPAGYSPSVPFCDNDNPFIVYVTPTIGDDTYNRYVFVNNELIESNTASYNVTVADGDVVKAYFAKKQPETYTVAFDCQGVATPAIKADYVTTVTTSTMQALPGTIIAIADDDAICAVAVGGVEIASDGQNFVFEVNADCQVVISAEAITARTISIDIDDPQAISALYGNEYQLELKAGTNAINLNDYKTDENVLLISTAEGYKINSITYNGLDVAYTDHDLGEGQFVFNNLVDGDALEIQASLVLRDKTLITYSAGLDKTTGTYLDDCTSTVSMGELVDGYGQIKFGDNDLPLLFGIFSYIDRNDTGFVYLNDEMVKYNYGWDIYANDGDVFKVYVGADAPEAYAVTYTIESMESRPVIVKDHGVYVEDDSHFALPGTHIAIEADGSEIAAVTVNDENLLPATDGKYEFEVNSACAVEIKGVSSALGSIIAPAKPRGIYNLQGMPLGNNPALLPAGLYIIDGQKVRVK